MNGAFSNFCNLSLICADPLAFREDLSLLQNLGLKKVHLDVMDSIFVPRFGLYPEIVSLIESEFEFEFDAHFMVSDVHSALLEWRKYQNPKKISFHYRGNENKVGDLLEAIRAGGSEAIVAFDLSVDDKEFLEVIEMHKLDRVMLLGITPGVLVQDHKPDSVIHRLNIIRDYLESPPSTIQIDGGVNFATVGDFVALGVTDLVCGSSTIYKNVDFCIDKNKQQKIIQNVKR